MATEITGKKFDGAALRKQIHEAAVQATREVFEADILPAAKAGSPVDTGVNRDSIRVLISDDPEKGTVTGKVFTESGYGWLIEHGTSHNRELTKRAISKRRGRAPVNDRTPARPYIYPALQRFCAKIAERARAILNGGSADTKAA